MPVARARAEAIVQELPERAQALNEDTRYLHYVLRLAVFGSFLASKQLLGDVDIFVEIAARRQRDQIDWLQFVLDFPLPRYLARDRDGRMHWPKIKLLRELKIGRGMHLHDWNELKVLDCNHRVIWDVRKQYPDRTVGANVGANAVLA